MRAPTDYTPGDEPVPVGTVVEYEGRKWQITEHKEPQDHPYREELENRGFPPLEEAYPDGKAYFLWEVGVPKKLDAYGSKIWVRRTSFRLAREDEGK